MKYSVVYAVRTCFQVVAPHGIFTKHGYYCTVSSSILCTYRSLYIAPPFVKNRFLQEESAADQHSTVYNSSINTVGKVTHDDHVACSVRVHIKFHVTAQSGPVILLIVILCHS